MVLLGPALAESRMAAKDANSVANMKNIGCCLTMYSDDNWGWAPQTLDDLTDFGYLPSMSEDSVYLGHGIRIASVDVPREFPLVVTKLEGTGKICVLFADGSVEVRSEYSPSTTLIEACESLLKQYDGGGYELKLAQRTLEKLQSK